MSAHNLLNARPAATLVNGRKMVPLSYVEALEDQLRDMMRQRSELRGYFATIRELWNNIPEQYANMTFAKSSENLRKHALIKTGWCQTDTVVFETTRQAARNAANIGYIARMGHGYAITLVRENVVMCTIPRSQSLDAMGKEDFKQSKSDVLDFCRGLIGVTAQEQRGVQS